MNPAPAKAGGDAANRGAATVGITQALPLPPISLFWKRRGIPRLSVCSRRALLLTVVDLIALGGE